MKLGHRMWAPVHPGGHKRSLLISYGDGLGDCNIFLGYFCVFMSKFSAYESHGLVSFENNCVYPMQRTEAD